MLSKSDRAKAAQILIDAERTKKQGKQLSVTLPKIDIEDAYAIQQAWVAIKVAEGPDSCSSIDNAHSGREATGGGTQISPMDEARGS